jgi:hypothetical protein
MQTINNKSNNSNYLEYISYKDDNKNRVFSL